MLCRFGNSQINPVVDANQSESKLALIALQTNYSSEELSLSLGQLEQGPQHTVHLVAIQSDLPSDVGVG